MPSDLDSSWNKLLNRTVSFDDRKNTSYYERTSMLYDDLIASSRREEFFLDHPWGGHGMMSERSNEPVHLPRRRSRSFDDFIDGTVIEPVTNSTTGLTIPPPSSSWGQYKYGTNNDDDTEKSVGDSRREHSRRSIHSEFECGQNMQHNNKKHGHNEDNQMPFYMSMLYGGINCTIIVPVIMSFGNIIYRDDAFVEHMPILIKLTLFSGAIHQLCFSSFSTLKFAVGSVQDAGLIFLSKIAADIALHCKSNSYDDETMLATVTVGLSLATAALGVGLIVIGKLGLASYVQMLPTCVVAGYLAYIGFFVGISGLEIMGGGSFSPVERLMYITPGIAGGTLIYVSVRKLRHVAVLPLCISFLLASFYIILTVTGTSIETATDNGWIRKSQHEPLWYQTWDYFKFDKIVWSAFPQIWLTWLGMLFVVALSSSLDVAAIELEMDEPLNYNKELKVVGISNLVSGMTGGYTGSYIFSQTIFSLRIGVRSRIAGFSIAVFQLIIILCPFPILSYVPNFFYGSLLSMICIDLVYEWLWEFRTKVTVAEYIIGLSTFGLIQFLGVEYGIIAGVVVYFICRRFKINVGDLKEIRSVEENHDHDNNNDDLAVSDDACREGKIRNVIA